LLSSSSQLSLLLLPLSSFSLSSPSSSLPSLSLLSPSPLTPPFLPLCFYLIVVCARHCRCVAAIVVMISRRQCPIDVGIKVNLFLFEFNWTTVSYKPTATEELSPSISLDLEAKSLIRCQAGNDEKHLILVGVQTEVTGQVTAMVVAHIEQITEQLGTEK